MDVDKIKCELLIFDCEPDVVSQLLKLEPTQIIKVGDVKRKDPNGVNPPLLEERNIWVWSTNIDTESIEEHIDAMFLVFKPKSAELSKLSAKYPIELSIYGNTIQSQIGIHLEKQWIKKLADFGVELDVDIYSLA